eukprot:scaffold192939_cov18-Tisochrysis_lutea.AAC.1
MLNLYIRHTSLEWADTCKNTAAAAAAAAHAVTDRWITPIANSPKPPPERITMTLPVINAAKEVVVVAGGESKAEVVQRVLEIMVFAIDYGAGIVRSGAFS